MTKRKQTPDVLAEILGGDLPDETNHTASVIGSASTTKQSSASKFHDYSPQEWDYKLITFQDYKGWRPRYINGKELKDWTNGPLIHEFISMMGEEGWELAAASAGERLYGSGDNHQLYFKRPKE